jgi:uncharacterized protein YndB with AHSA1/START domain
MGWKTCSTGWINDRASHRHRGTGVFPHAPAKLWRALTQPHLIAEWLMKNDFQLVPGHRFKLTGQWGASSIARCSRSTPNAPYRWDFNHDDPAYA